MNHPVVTSLVPILLMIAAGYLAGRRGWVSRTSAKDIANLVFLVLMAALLFRTMSKVHPQDLDFSPVLAYFIGVGLLFGGTLALCGFNRRGAVLALATTFSNTIMMGIPMVSLSFGEAGLVTLFTLYTVHTVLLLTAATLVLELAVLREGTAEGAPRSLMRSLLLAVRNAMLHPVPLPIFAALIFGQTGLPIPDVLDKTLQLLGSAFGPMALILVGITLAHTPVSQHVRGALGLILAKNVLHPALVAAAALLLGVKGLALAVVVIVASLPVGANVFLFSQRYKVAEDTVTATVALSTLAAGLTVPIVLALVQAFLLP